MLKSAKLNRRQTLRLLGGGAVIAAAGIGYDVTRLPNQAVAPWAQAGHYEDPRMRALSWAILAPNPHNMQPWLVDLSVPDQAVLYVDPTRLLPHTDPFNRQITIGLGCFLETLRLAALQDSLEAQFDLFPEGENPEQLDRRPVAIVRFVPSEAASDPLFQQVPHRRSVKEPYDLTRDVPNGALDRVATAVEHTTFGYSVDRSVVEPLRTLTHEALRIELLTPRTLQESIDVFRIGRREVNATPDGIDFSGPMFEVISRLGLFTRAKAADSNSTAFQSALDAISENALSAMGFVWLVTEANDRVSQIRVGQDWVRTHLALTAEGIAMHPMSQALQEYPEMAELYAEAHARLAPEGGTVQMLSRVGYGPDVPTSPRWPLEEKLVG